MVVLKSNTFQQNLAYRGDGAVNAGNGLGKGGAVFVLHQATAANGNPAGLPAQLPMVTGCANTFSANSADDAASTDLDNPDTFGVSRAGLIGGCPDMFFSNGFEDPSSL
ncbi:MAG: hypothetical protein ACSLE2_05855 [Lysobacterales bacterium]